MPKNELFTIRPIIVHYYQLSNKTVKSILLYLETEIEKEWGRDR